MTEDGHIQKQTTRHDGMVNDKKTEENNRRLVNLGNKKNIFCKQCTRNQLTFWLELCYVIFVYKRTTCLR